MHASLKALSMPKKKTPNADYACHLLVALKEKVIPQTQ
jgi:hypothetical protein